MIFCGFLSTQTDVEHWRQSIHRHADWLRMSAHVEMHQCHNSSQIGWAWIHPSSASAPSLPALPERGEIFHLNATYALTDLAHMDAGDTDGLATRLHVDLRRGTVEIAVPTTTPEQWYHSQNEFGVVFCNDLRWIVSWKGFDVDPHGIFSLLQFGAIVPPFTISKSVFRIPAGHRLTIRGSDQEPQITPIDHPLGESHSIADPLVHVRETLDATLVRVPRQSTLFFSGGVDSSLLAARFKAMGRDDIQLLNVSFGADDQEGQFALAMAKALEMPCEQIVYDPRYLAITLERIGTDYSFPFGDFSVIPTHLLVLASHDQRAPAIIDGTGADGAFGQGMQYRTWKTIYAIPSFLRAFVASSYTALYSWPRESKAAKVARIMRRTAHLSLPLAAVMVQNSLDNIAYHMPDRIRNDLESAALHQLQHIAGKKTHAEQLSILDMIFVCAGEMAAKSFDPVRFSGRISVYPFLAAKMAHLSASLSWAQKSPNGEPKGLLKQLLAQTVPSHLVYRRKSGFEPPFAIFLANPTFQEYLSDFVVSSSNPLAPYFDAKVVRSIIRETHHGKKYHDEIYNFIWTLLFVSRWIQSLPRHS